MDKKWTYVVLFLLLGSLFLLNCATVTEVFAPEPTPTSTPPAALGVPISKGSWQLTVEEVSTADSLKMGAGFGNATTFTPKEGYAFLVVAVRIRNLDPTRSLSITGKNMAIIDESGTIKTAEGGGWSDSNMCAGCVFSISQSVGSDTMSGWMVSDKMITFGQISPGEPVRFVYIVRTGELEQEWKLQFQEIPPLTFKLGDKATYPLSSTVESATSRLPVECTAENIRAAQNDTGVLFQVWEEDHLVVKFAKPDGSAAVEVCKGYAFNKFTYADDGAILMTAGPLQGWTNLYLFEPGGKIRILAQNSSSIQASFVPGTQYVIFKVTRIGEDNAEIYVLDRKEATETLLFEGKWANYRVFSNGYVLLTGMPLDDGERVQLFGPLTAGEVEPVTLPEDVNTESITDDGGHLLYTDYAGDKTRLYYSGIDGSDKKEIFSGDLHYGAKFMSPDGQHLLISASGELNSEKVQAVVINVATSESTSIAPESDSVEYRFSPDGQWIVVISTFNREESDDAKTEKQIMYIYNVKEGKVVKEISGDIVNYLFSQDNAYLGYTLKNEDETLTISILQLSDMTESQPGNGILEGWNIGE